jgi:hypothetical protein
LPAIRQIYQKEIPALSQIKIKKSNHANQEKEKQIPNFESNQDKEKAIT